MVKWNPEILNKFVASNIAEFCEANIPELTEQFPQSRYWIANQFLSNSLRGSFNTGMRQVVLALIRRSYNALQFYHDAREKTSAYLKDNEPLNPNVTKYYNAVTTWENFVLQVSMNMDQFRWMNQGTGVFQKKDGSKEYRIYHIANLIKHTHTTVASGQCKDSDTLPLWLQRDGLYSFESKGYIP